MPPPPDRAPPGFKQRIQCVNCIREFSVTFPAGTRVIGAQATCPDCGIQEYVAAKGSEARHQHLGPAIP